MSVASPQPGGVDVSVRGLTHRYRPGRRARRPAGDGAGRVTVLEDLDLHLPAGGYATLVGRSGAGKSTLLAVLGGLEPMQEGLASVGGVDLAELAGDELASYRRATVGFVFQHFGLIATLSARENIELASVLAHKGRAGRRHLSDELLEAVGLADRAEHKPTELSGGERQRVAIARALANSPRLILADEPTGNLDEDAAVRVIELLERLHTERGCTLVVVTHNRLLAGRAPRRLAFSKGRLVPA